MDYPAEIPGCFQSYFFCVATLQIKRRVGRLSQFEENEKTEKR